MQQETNPEITAFVEQYLAALVQCNMEALQALVVDANQFDEVVLQKRKEYITAYTNIQCYTKPGKTENTYINTTGKKDAKYYYKAKLMIYDNEGNLTAQTELKQCRYGKRIWTR